MTGFTSGARRRRLSAGASLFILASAVSAQQAAAQDAGASSEASAGADEREIIVTAQHRVERLKDVPQAVTVLGGEALAKSGATQLRDFVGQVPGLNIQSAGGLSQISMRGVNIDPFNGQTVGIYVDEVPYGSSAVLGGNGRVALDVGLFDLDRLEVLRGPQGTLYGASSMGGLIKYVTPLPDSRDFGGQFRAGISDTRYGGTSFNVAGSVNLPIVTDKLALRVGAYESRDGGFIDNVALGRRNVDRGDTYGGRFDLLFTPVEDLSVRITGFLQKIKRDGFATADFTLAGVPVVDTLSQRRLIDEGLDQDFRLISGTIKYDFGPVDLTSVTAFQRVRTTYRTDLSAIYIPLLTGLGRPYGAVGLTDRLPTDKFTQELRLAGDTGLIQWQVGGFYTHETSEYAQDFNLLDTSRQPVPNIEFTSSRPIRFEEVALFGNLTWKITDKFDITGGVRWARNNQSILQNGGGLLGSSRPLARSHEGVVTYLANARYRFNDNTMAYARFATGYRPGGVNFAFRDPATGLLVAGPTFDSDTLLSYEIGLKTESDDRRFALDLAAYHIDWNDMIVQVVRGGFGGRYNARGGATVDGTELALTARPSVGLTLVSSFAYQDAKIAKDDPELGAKKGERLPNSPRFTAAFSLDYELPVGSVKPTVGASLRYMGDRTSTFSANTSFPRYRAPDFVTIDLRAGISIGDIDVQAYIRNLLDERGQLLAPLATVPTTGPLPVGIIQPRTIGMTVSTRF